MLTLAKVSKQDLHQVHQRLYVVLESIRAAAAAPLHYTRLARSPWPQHREHRDGSLYLAGLVGGLSNFHPA